MEKLNIYQRIVEVMKVVDYVQKEDRKVNNLFKFVSHDAVTGALHKPMAENGIVMIPSVIELIQDGNRTQVKMEISFVNADDPVDRIIVTHYGYGIDPQDKGIGKAISYCVKYALLKMFCLETGDDAERDNIEYDPESKPQEPVKKPSDFLSQEQKEKIMALVGNRKDVLKEFLATSKRTSLDQIPSKWFDAAIKYVQTKIDMEEEQNEDNSWLKR